MGSLLFRAIIDSSGLEVDARPVLPGPGRLTTLSKEILCHVCNDPITCFFRPGRSLVARKTGSSSKDQAVGGSQGRVVMRSGQEGMRRV